VTPREEGVPPADETDGGRARAGRFTISTRMSFLLIGGMALGGIVLMCLTILLLVLLQ